MELKLSILGLLINTTFVLALCSAIFRRQRWLWHATLLLAVVVIVERTFEVQTHVPLRNLFEAFLWLPLCMPICTWLSKRINQLDTQRMDAILCVIFLFPVAFVFSEEIKPLMPALRSHFFVPHVMSYMIAYALMARALTLALMHHARAAEQSATIGFFAMTLGLALGSIWGNEVWGGYWQWDPKEMWSLATWLVYLCYFHELRKPLFKHAPTMLLALGFLFIVLTVTWINLSKLFPGMHSYA